MTDSANLVEDESWGGSRCNEHAVAMERNCVFCNPRRQIDQAEQLHCIGRRDEIACEDNHVLYFKATSMCGGPSADCKVVAVDHSLDFGRFNHGVESRLKVRHLNNFRGDLFAWCRSRRG